MKISIIGATGFVGKALVNEALLRHHQVMAI
ncbi:NAD(P)-dependent oxidoreductase, partial [Escherichia coli]